MSWGFLICGLVAFIALVAIAERWSIMAVVVLVLVVGLLACTTAGALSALLP